jgi:hypothetical protein
MRTRFVGALLSLLSAMWLAADASAQALTPPKGEGTVSLVLTNAQVIEHLDGLGDRVKMGDIRANTVLVDVTYGLTDKLSLTLSLPWVTSRYQGPEPHPNTTIDDGSPYSAFQDVRFDVRYNVMRGPAWITPFIATTVPSSTYAAYGHAAPGRRVKELQTGVSVAKVLDPWIPRMFVQGRYAFGFAEELAGHRPNRSYMDIEAGYFLTASIRAFGIVTAHHAHGGVNYPPAGALGPALFPYHDRIAAENMINAGGGFGFGAGESFDFFASLVRTVSGRNGHALDYGATFGMTWTFKKGVEAAAALANRPEGSLVKCACQKQARLY